MSKKNKSSHKKDDSKPKVPTPVATATPAAAPKADAIVVQKPKVEAVTITPPAKKPEVKPEVKAEVKPEVKAEVKTEVKPEVKAEVKPEVKAEAKPAVKAEDKKPTAEKPAVKKPAAKKPATKKAEPKKAEPFTPALSGEVKTEATPAVKKPEAKKTATKKPATKKTAEAKKPALPKATADKKVETSTPKKEGSVAMPKKKVVLVGSECVPFAKTGGLADVLGTLPSELNKLDVDACVFLPFHKVIKDKYRMDTEHVTFFYINLGWRTKFVGVEKLVLNGVTYFFIDNEDYFGGPIYLGKQPEGEQYAFFCRAVLEAMLRMDFIPDVIHLNDWQTAMIAMLLRTQYQATALNGVKTLFTIHNMMYQGMYGFDFVQSLLGVDTRYYTPEFIEANGCANFMKAGLVFCDRISTVSPTYASELCDPYYAYNLEGILNARAHETSGILNGIDISDYNPETDVHIPAHFSKTNLKGKEENKRILMEKLGLHYSKDTPLIGIVSRLTSQKGFDLIKSIFHELMALNVSVVLLGTGDKEYEAFFGRMENEYRGRVCAYIGYNNEVAHQIYAGADLFLMPSKFEPCGISQMIAQRYGTLPIARETGGLKDTVLPYNEYTGEGTGFTFTNYNSHDMLDMIKYALYSFEDPKKRDKLIQNAMNCDNSFAVSAKKYRDLYFNL